jgi:hypothetical protein
MSVDSVLEFELTLLSNSSMDLYPGNTMSAFTTELSERLTLPGKWGVALSNIIYPSKIRNVPKTHIWHTHYPDDVESNPIEAASNTETHTLWFPGGSYCDANEILQELLDRTKPFGAEFTWTIGHDDHVQFRFLTKDSFTFDSHTITNILGYSNQTGRGISRLIPDIYAALPYFTDFPNSINITGGRNLLFIYTDIVEHQIVGDTKAALLRLLPLTQSLGNCKQRDITNVISPIITDLQFKPVLLSAISRIRIELRDEMGELIPFMGDGRTAITLKFKKT